MEDARIVEVALDAIMRAAAAWSERSCSHLRRLGFWNRTRRPEGELSQGVDEGI